MRSQHNVYIFFQHSLGSQHFLRCSWHLQVLCSRSGFYGGRGEGAQPQGHGRISHNMLSKLKCGWGLARGETKQIESRWLGCCNMSPLACLHWVHVFCPSIFSQVLCAHMLAFSACLRAPQRRITAPHLKGVELDIVTQAAAQGKDANDILALVSAGRRNPSYRLGIHWETYG